MTDVYILNTDYEVIGIVDNYSSAIFNRRYWEYGDFELYIKANRKSLELLQPDYYVRRDGDTYIYVIESIELTTDQENGDFLTVKGRSAESILDRRILYNHRATSDKIGGFMVSYPTDILTTVEDCIYHALEMTIAPTDLNPYNTNWAWDGNFTLGEKQGFTEQISQVQVVGTNLYDFISEQCQLNGYGFRVHLNDNQKFEFNLYKGRDCSYNQTENPYIIFSPEFDNLSNTTYIFDNTNFKSHIITAGEGDGDERLWIERFRKDTYYLSGVARREIFLDNKSLSSKDVQNYIGLLDDMANQEIIKYNITESFDGDTISNNMNYNLGDIVQIENEYGIQATARILEIIDCEDESGYSTVPTFSTWEV